MIRLSYILPCYNIERFVGKCLDSIYNQSLPETDFEVICVNDCSPDGTRDVVVEYQKKHKNLILIDHEKNKRVGAARNTGFYAAKGEYVWFIDPDDLLHENAATELLHLLDEDQLDFIQFNHDWMTEQEVPIPNPPFSHNFMYDTPVMSGVDFIHEYQKNGLTFANMHVGCFVRIYRRSYLLENNIIFPEVAFYEDQYQALHGLIAAKKMRNVNKDYYSYRVVESSYSHVPMSIIKRASQLSMCVGMVRLMERYGLKELIPFVWIRFVGDLHYLCTHFVLFMPNKDRSQFIDLVKNDLQLVHEMMPETNGFLAKYPNTYKLFANVVGPVARRIRDIKRKK